MGEADLPFLTFDQRALTGFTFTITLDPATTGVPVEVQVEVFVCCETEDIEYDFHRTVILTESEFPSFLVDCLGIVEGLVLVVKQNSEERREL